MEESKNCPQEYENKIYLLRETRIEELDFSENSRACLEPEVAREAREFDQGRVPNQIRSASEYYVRYGR